VRREREGVIDFQDNRVDAELPECSPDGFWYTSLPDDQTLRGVWGDGLGIVWAVIEMRKRRMPRWMLMAIAVSGPLAVVALGNHWASPGSVAAQLAASLAIAGVVGDRWPAKVLGAHILVDESVAFARARGTGARARRAYWTSGLLLFTFWNTGAVLGVVAGSAVPDPGAGSFTHLTLPTVATW